jgi:hypothetical protein
LKNFKKLKYLDSFLKRKESGEDIPFLRNVPSIDPDHAWIIQGYELLAGRRGTVEGVPQPIPVSEIAAYADYMGITDEIDREDFLLIVCRLDGLALDFAAEATAEARNKQRREQAKAQRSAKRRR